MHKILERLLKRYKVALDSPPDLENWKAFLAHIDRTYAQADQDRYLMERSLAISSREMQELYDTERKEAEAALKVSEGKYRMLFDNALDSIFVIDAETRKILDVNQIAADRLGYTREELLELTIDDLNPASETADRDELLGKIHKAGSLTFERTHIHKDGSLIPVEVSTSIHEHDGRAVFQSIVRDITARKEAEEKLRTLATHDPLTGLSNRTLFNDRISHAIDIASRKSEMLAVFFIDLDDFKSINDAFGHKQGDRLLQTIAERLSASVRKSDTVARIGGDEFAILLEGIQKEKDVAQVVETVIKAISEPYTLQNSETFITGSVGISVFPKDGETPDSLIQNADRAMYSSKEDGKNTYQYFSPAMTTQALERLELGNQLRIAIEEQKLVLHYQPQIDSRTGEVIGVEALLRWPHPERGLLHPDQFIPIAILSGLIVPLTDWVLQSAARQIGDWRAKGIDGPRLALNLSARDVKQPNLADKIAMALETMGTPPDMLELELSEKIIFQQLDASLGNLQELREAGVRLAIDDFGTGYSTLSDLADFPFDTLKIHQHFATRIALSAKHAAIVKGITTISKNLGVDVIVEGVENEQQLSFYEKLECYHIQGWVFGEAKAAEDLEPILKEGIPRPQLQLGLDEAPDGLQQA